MEPIEFPTQSEQAITFVLKGKSLTADDIRPFLNRVSVYQIERDLATLEIQGLVTHRKKFYRARPTVEYHLTAAGDAFYDFVRDWHRRDRARLAAKAPV